MSQAALDKIHELNREYKGLTGTEAYLYATSPGDLRGTRYVFATSDRPIIGSGEALAHMTDVITKARSGWTHTEITHGRERTT